jgi:parallel beta-helix repeat protein
VWHGCNRTTISDCHIHDGGHVHESGVGILIGKASGTVVQHNSVHDFGYSGISVGWAWYCEEGNAYGNAIEYNHVYNIGRGELSDLAGIYTLGVAPGTRIRFNRIHDIRCRTHFAWGIYLDACSSGLLIENNVVFRAAEGSLMMNHSRGHTIRNNIFALSDKYQLRRNVLVSLPTCTFERNIVCSSSAPLWVGDWKETRADLHHNLYFVERGKRKGFAGLSFRQWQKRGLDAGSLFADPKFRDPEKGDFRLARNSPAFRVGFVPFDCAAVGPRPG